MSKLVLIENALPLPAPDVEALIQGRMIAAIPRRSLDRGKQFALYPANFLINLSPLEQHYRSSFLPIAQTVLANLATETVTIKAWARCELCQMPDNPESLEALSRLTVWTPEALKQILLQRQFLFLAHLRVYLLPQPIEIPVHPNGQDKRGKFVPLPYRLTVSEANPVLSDRLFNQRRKQLEKLESPLNPELEELQAMVSQINLPAAQQLNDQIKQFLGWKTNTYSIFSDPNLAWIKDIKALGERSKEQDTGKGNYQAGTDFENVVRDSLEFLGFTIDYSHKGGAGGLDLFCSKPYPLVGECKAGKKIPNPTAVQLLNLATLRLQDSALIKKSTKLIIGPGEPLKQLKDAALVHGMSIINPETLEKLVKLQAVYPNSIDLFKLKEYLKPGQSDDEVQKYIEQVSSQIKLRSQIVQAVKQLGEPGSEHLTVEIRVHYNAVFAKDSNSKLDDIKVYNLLVELSSPLTGYLGRGKGKDGSDHFYFLRDLSVD
jgi:hypothetical protein